MVERAYCSLADQRQDLVDTAGTLGLALPPPDFEQWRDTRPEDFAQACDVLITVRTLDRSALAVPAAKVAAPAPNYLALGFSALIGALLAWLATEWKSRRDRYYAAAQALRTAATAFLREGNTALRTLSTPMGQLNPTAYFAARDELISRLHEAAALHRTDLGTSLVAELLAGKADRVVEGWPFKPDARAVRKAEAAVWVSAAAADVHRLAAVLQKLRPGALPAATATAHPVGS